jgi:U3 small nucleolar RNA-associated protein 23
VITQCEIRKLYAQKTESGVSEAIEVAKSFERRRCGHHPDEYPEPLSTEECLLSVVDPKESGQNKHRYVVASQGQDVRRMLRGVQGTPLIYIKRSVMILEPMADESAQLREREERMKFRAEIKSALIGKRKREREDEGEGDGKDDDADEAASPAREKKKKSKGKGPKGPNPLAVKKPKKKTQEPSTKNKAEKDETKNDKAEKLEKGTDEAPAKRKRRRRNKASKGEEDSEAATSSAPTTAVTAVDAD